MSDGIGCQLLELQSFSELNLSRYGSHPAVFFNIEFMMIRCNDFSDTKV